MKDKLQKAFEKYYKCTKRLDISAFASVLTVLHCFKSKQSTHVPSDGSEYKTSIRIVQRLLQTADGKSFIACIEEYARETPYHQRVTDITNLYEESAEGKKAREKIGAFYTPIKYSIMALKSYRESSVTTVFDPFCGCGSWLAAANIVYGHDKVEVFGTDIDLTAILVARLVVAWAKERSPRTLKVVEKNLVALDTLYPSTKEQQKLAEFAGQAALVATNPPYGFSVKSRPTSVSEAPIPDKEVFYLSILRVLHDAPRTPAMFLVPNTMLLNVGSEKFRSWLSTSYCARVTDHSAETLFESATVRNILLETSPGSGLQVRKSFSDKWIQPRNLTALAERNQLVVSDLFQVSQGLIPYDKYRGHSENQIRNRVFHADSKVDASFKPEIQGKDVTVCRVERKTSSWIKYGPWLAAPRDQKFFKQPRVLIREITSSKHGHIYCAFTDREFYNTPSIINVVSKDERITEANLKTLSVLLSSDLYSEIHFNSSPKAQKGLFPKILVRDVRNLPLPENFMTLNLSHIYDCAVDLADRGSDENEIRTFISDNVAKANARTGAA